jgi:hypothetical protein
MSRIQQVFAVWPYVAWLCGCCRLTPCVVRSCPLPPVLWFNSWTVQVRCGVLRALWDHAVLRRQLMALLSTALNWTANGRMRLRLEAPSSILSNTYRTHGRHGIDIGERGGAGWQGRRRGFVVLDDRGRQAPGRRGVVVQYSMHSESHVCGLGCLVSVSVLGRTVLLLARAGAMRYASSSPLSECGARGTTTAFICATVATST